MPRISIQLIQDLERRRPDKNRIWDDKIKGFGISIQQNSMSYIIQYRNAQGKQKYLTLGRVGKITPDQARDLARKKFADLAYDKDPANERAAEKSVMILAELCDWYLTEGNLHKKPRTRGHDKSAVEHHIKPLIGKLPIKEITRGIIERFVRDIESGDKIRRREKSKNPRGVAVVSGGVSAATSTLGVLGCMFQFAIKHELLDRKRLGLNVRFHQYEM